MPAGDGAIRTVEGATCEWCGAVLAGSLTVRVDDWMAFTCRDCEAEARTAVPATCVLHALSTVEEGEGR